MGEPEHAPADLRRVLAELVALKDGPRDAEYARCKPLAWAAAHHALAATEPEGATVTEWGVRQAGGGTGWAAGSLAHVGTDESAARRVLATRPGDELVNRQRTIRADVVTDWEVAR